MDSIIYVILRGLAIGVLISAPMGPIGMLVIQRTLTKGRVPALYTGIGAAISDLIYCVITGCGIAFITDFLDQHQLIIQIIGSIVLMLFGIVLWRKNPSRMQQKNDDEPEATTHWSDLVSGFFLTFSNPAILFFIIGLFARFNFLLPDYEYHHYFLGYLSIAGGAFAWWFGITYLVNKMRAHFNVRSLYIINRLIGSLLIIFAIVGTVTAIFPIF